MPEPTQSSTIAFRFVQDPSYRVVPVNGAWGGITPRRQFLVNFFVEAFTPPDLLVHERAPDGRVGREIQRRAPDAPITRTFVSGIVVSIDEAELIADWMKRKVVEYREQQKKP